LLAKAFCQLIKDALPHRNREQAHSHRDGVCYATARRLDDEQIPTIHAPPKNHVKSKSPVGAIGGYDGREDGRSVTSMVLGTPQSRASALLHIARQPAFSSSHGRRC
jgi:hypothetical protein